MLDMEELKEALPKGLQKNASQNLLDMVNNSAKDPEVAKVIRENFISYTTVLEAGKFKLEDYLNAVTYVSYLLMNNNNQQSWAKTFPEKYKELKASGATKKVISSYVAIYNKGKLVNLVRDQASVSFYILNADFRQKALEQQAFLMVHAASEKVQTEAANSVLTHTKPPETSKIELDVTAKVDPGMTEMREMMHSMAQAQRKLIESGVPTQRIAHQQLGEMIDVSPIDIVDVTPAESVGSSQSKQVTSKRAAPKRKMTFKTVKEATDE